MKIKNNIFSYIILLLFFSITICKNQNKPDFYFRNSIHLGYDSNVTKYSDSENNSLITSGFIALKPTLQGNLKIFKRKTKIIFSTRIHYYLDIDEKSNYGYGISINQSIGNYQHIKYSYSFIDDIYLRKYNDLDHLFSLGYIYHGSDCYFDLIKHKISYESPFISDRDKIEISIFNEKQYYNPEFTEYDLDINGASLKLFTKAKDAKYVMIFGFLEADSLFSHNQEFLTEDKYGNSLRYVDRSYKENNVKISYTSIQKTKSLGCSISQRNRKYLSNNDFTVDDWENSFIVDELHKNRKHKDYIISVWSVFKYGNNKNKITLSYRNRETSSPYEWVEKLKSFSKYNLEYVVYFNKIKF